MSLDVINALRCGFKKVTEAVNVLPSAVEIADAMVIAERNSKTGHFAKFRGNATETLGLPAGTRGNLVAISDTSSGLVYFSLSGAIPNNLAGSDKGETTGPYLAVNLHNIDLSDLRFDASSSSGDYTVYYEIYT